MSYASQNVCGAGNDTESVSVSSLVAANCDTSGSYTPLADIGPGGSSITDYDLQTYGTTDICIKIVSDELSPYRDEFIVDHAVSGHQTPAIVTYDWTAVGEATGKGAIIGGSYLNTTVSDDSRETLQEGGSSHQLFHVYTIDNIQGNFNKTLIVEGYRQNNTDGDNFQVFYKWTTGTCPTSGLFASSGITINSSTEQTYTATIGNNTGRLCVAVGDTAGGSNNDTVKIDYLAVQHGTCP
jgi:hypothetical protein